MQHGTSVLAPAPLMSTSVIHALSIDLEEWYHGDLVRGRLTSQDRVSQVLEAVAPLVKLLEGAGVRATFFTGRRSGTGPPRPSPVARPGRDMRLPPHQTHRNLWWLSAEGLQTELEEYRRATIDAVVPDEQVWVSSTGVLG